MLLFLCRNYSHSQRVVGVLQDINPNPLPQIWPDARSLEPSFSTSPLPGHWGLLPVPSKTLDKKGGAGYWNTGTIFLGIFEHCKGEGPRKGLSSKRNVPFFPPSHRGTTLTGCGQNPGRTASGSSAGCQSAAGRAAGCPPPAGAGPASGRATCWAHTTAR